MTSPATPKNYVYTIIPTHETLPEPLEWNPDSDVFLAINIPSPRIGHSRIKMDSTVQLSYAWCTAIYSTPGTAGQSFNNVADKYTDFTYPKGTYIIFTVGKINTGKEKEDKRKELTKKIGELSKQLSELDDKNP